MRQDPVPTLRTQMPDMLSVNRTFLRDDVHPLRHPARPTDRRACNLNAVIGVHDVDATAPRPGQGGSNEQQ